jgi:hypothetical protein
LTSRLLADRRGGVDRRAVPRRTILALVPVNRRQVVDLRRGADRRSTLDRRNATRPRASEAPGEHIRNALQLLHHINETDGLDVEQRADLAAALRRLERALDLLERRARVS